MKTSAEKPIRITLGLLLLVLAINAFAGGYYGMAGAEGVPLEWLSGSPFDSYFVPSLILFVVVGGAALTSAILVFKKHPKAWLASVSTAIIVLIWLAVQLRIIGYVSWMQPTTAGIAFLILLFTALLMRVKAQVN